MSEGLENGYLATPTASHPAVKLLRTLRPGQHLVYHVGYLPHDRTSDARVAEVAEEAQQLYQRGLIELLQRRRDEYFYEYVAVGRTRE